MCIRDSILAHLIQGAEAAALLAAFNLHPNDIVLLQHDGFVAHRRLNAKAIELAVKEATGLALTLEEQQIRIDPDAQFLKYQTKKHVSDKKSMKSLA